MPTASSRTSRSTCGSRRPVTFCRLRRRGGLSRAGSMSPLGIAEIDEECDGRSSRGDADRPRRPGGHAREHSLEMQLPFLRRLAPEAKIVPLLMGAQTDGQTARCARRRSGDRCRARRCSSLPAPICRTTTTRSPPARLDAVVIDHVARFDADGLQRALDVRPEHACGGGPAVAVMRAARQLGARDAVDSEVRRLGRRVGRQVGGRRLPGGRAVATAQRRTRRR